MFNNIIKSLKMDLYVLIFLKLLETKLYSKYVTCFFNF